MGISHATWIIGFLGVLRNMSSALLFASHMFMFKGIFQQNNIGNLKPLVHVVAALYCSFGLFYALLHGDLFVLVEYVVDLFFEEIFLIIVVKVSAASIKSKVYIFVLCSSLTGIAVAITLFAFHDMGVRSLIAGLLVIGSISMLQAYSLWFAVPTVAQQKIWRIIGYILSCGILVAYAAMQPIDLYILFFSVIGLFAYGTLLAVKIVKKLPRK